MNLLRRPAEPEPSDGQSSEPVGETQELIKYGSTWGDDCHRSRRLLSQYQIPYYWINISADPAAAQRILVINRGRRAGLTIVVPDGSTVTESSSAAVGRKLGPSP